MAKEKEKPPEAATAPEAFKEGDVVIVAAVVVAVGEDSITLQATGGDEPRAMFTLPLKHVSRRA